MASLRIICICTGNYVCITGSRCSISYAIRPTDKVTKEKKAKLEEQLEEVAKEVADEHQISKIIGIIHSHADHTSSSLQASVSLQAGGTLGFDLGRLTPLSSSSDPLSAFSKISTAALVNCTGSVSSEPSAIWSFSTLFENTQLGC